MNRVILTAVAAVLALVAAACSVEVERNADGSLQIATAITEASIETEIRAAIADPLVRDFQVDLKDGYVLVSAQRDEVLGDETVTVSFRLDLSVSDGHLGAVISDAEVDDEPVPSKIVDVWNERLATQLERAGKRNPDNTLERVTVTDGEVQMEWRVETAQSRS